MEEGQVKAAALGLGAGALLGGLSTMLLFATYGKASRKSKGIWKPALIVGGVSVLISAVAGIASIGVANAMSGMPILGLHSAQQSVGRMGMYMTPPTVKRFSSFTGVRHYS